jgi:hypothetical protein
LTTVSTWQNFKGEWSDDIAPIRASLH